MYIKIKKNMKRKFYRDKAVPEEKGLLHCGPIPFQKNPLEWANLYCRHLIFPIFKET